MSKLINKIKNIFMNKVTINGHQQLVSGNNITVQGTKIMVDGKVIHTFENANETVHIKWEGSLANLDCTSCDISGDVNGRVDCTSIKIGGNVTGDIDATSVTVQGNVDGDIEGTSVKVRSHNGNIRM